MASKSSKDIGRHFVFWLRMDIFLVSFMITKAVSLAVVIHVFFTTISEN